VPVVGKLGKAGGAALGEEGRHLDHFCLRVDPFDERVIRHHLEAHGIVAGATVMRYGAQEAPPSM
jgi:hypothetical protein